MERSQSPVSGVLMLMLSTTDKEPESTPVNGGVYLFRCECVVKLCVTVMCLPRLLVTQLTETHLNTRCKQGHRW